MPKMIALYPPRAKRPEVIARTKAEVQSYDWLANSGGQPYEWWVHEREEQGWTIREVWVTYPTPEGT